MAFVSSLGSYLRGKSRSNEISKTSLQSLYGQLNFSILFYNKINPTQGSRIVVKMVMMNDIKYESRGGGR